MSPKSPLTMLITGGARGIGRGLVRHFVQSGHRVFTLDSDLEELQNTVSLALKQWIPEAESRDRNSGIKPLTRFAALTVDLKDRGAIIDAVGSVAQFCGENGKLDVLINNAMPGPHTWSDGRVMEDADAAIMVEWDEKVQVGLTAPFQLSRLCVPLLKVDEDEPSVPNPQLNPEEGGDGVQETSKEAERDPATMTNTKTKQKPGCIINISSTRAHQSEPDHEAYSAVKAGLLGLTQSLSISLGQRHNIRVNAIIPGWIHVGNENRKADAEKKQWVDGLTREDMNWHPAGRVGKVEDIIKTVEFLIESEFVTGEEIRVDGGVGRRMVYPE
ncbi:NAD(P)-binding protein [Delitschia confertaspora ATCC 74209]|uniref:NAD(P)-binding protein n=1 Tax=Delitschia confertaspora ATCC 74209 TaxID=1513339 RepID=A0A9P4JN74_9PLEO|nr:NAD(P)-binding protein [Delitschia confertaspora ATCC 74209]